MRPDDPAVHLDGLIARLLATGGVSAASALVATPDRVLWERRVGRRRLTTSPRGRRSGSDASAVARRGAGTGFTGAAAGHLPRPDDLFDLASLTKPWMATLALRLDEAGRLPLDTELGDAWSVVDPRWAGATLADLLSHRARLAAWTPLYRRCRTREGVAELLLSGRLPAARRATYSDLGFILWGLTAERLLGSALQDLFRANVIDLMGERVAFRPAARQAVECRLDNRREIELAAAQGVRVALNHGPEPGEPQDGNARFLDGVAGHAGLFGTARALWRLGGGWLAPGGLLRRGSVGRALSGRGRFHLGWARRTLRGSAGPGLTARAFGHTGFTGGSVWVDPVAVRVYVLLLHRTRVTFDPDPWRRRFHALAARL